MGCGNSSPSPTDVSANMSSTGRNEVSTKETNESSNDDDKPNYGGVYVGLSTAEQSNSANVQIGSLRESNRDTTSLMKPLWGDGLKI
uniref:overexpressed in colon carcinoma 1 protein homolog n=1 Tax=Solea senegalensis TaxID=28829 RepID=UPI001CD90DE7|nr:overexpressed in colon carcinoma 1 protein homolog [Solea senegalensis]